MEAPNLEYINNLSGDNIVFKTKLISILKRELPLEIETYQQEMKVSNLNLAAQAVHKLKHKVSILGLEKSYYIASDFEDNLKQDSLTLQDEFETILNLMQEFVKDL